MRADLYLHHVRIFKSRSLAAQACAKGNVLHLGTRIKPARDLKAGDVLDVERGDMRFVLRVLAFPEHRVGAALVPQFMENLTPPENYRQAAALREQRKLSAPQDRVAKPDKRQLRTLRAWLKRDEG